ncbi:abc transporter g family member 11 [Quercus suber]|uniref:Abc transporter g family member 11 n=1 Tax=Quercus suber TaxID=58331 RepID=A0AAW0J0G4_QUESU
MGPPGCGRSTLLDALSGNNKVFFESNNLKVLLEAVYNSAQLQLPDSMSKLKKKDKVETTIKEMGLQDAVDTRIGGWGVKGISGGQKRRVSICIEILTRPKLLFLDEPTSGLDSAASYYVMSKIASLGQRDGIGRTIIASIHQPNNEVFQLFQNPCLLSSGRTIYFDPPSAANEDVEQGLAGAKSTKEAIEILLSSYKSSERYEQLRKQVAEIHKPDHGELEMKRSHASFLTQCSVLLRRYFVNMYHDLGYYWLRIAIYITLGRLGSNIRQRGEILINGRKQALDIGSILFSLLKAFKIELKSFFAYVTQDDTLVMTLTVREAVYYSAQLQLPDSMSKSEKERAETAVKEMGLQDAVNTRIGGWGVKGISGAQKRVVRICIELLTHPKLLFLDEPTSGIDSAASYYVMSRIASLGQRDGIRRTIIASIHQPSSEVFQLFHNLCHLSSGRTVYFGPASAAVEVMVSRPIHQNPSDHYLKTINKDFQQDVEQGLAGAISTDEAIEILLSSRVQKLAEICKQECGELETRRSHASFLTQCFVLTRSFVNMNRDLGYYWLRLIIYIAIDLGLGLVFFNVGRRYASIQVREYQKNSGTGETIDNTVQTSENRTSIS